VIREGVQAAQSAAAMPASDAAGKEPLDGSASGPSGFSSRIELRKQGR
jgi:hypothetical protein